MLFAIAGQKVYDQSGREINLAELRNIAGAVNLSARSKCKKIELAQRLERYFAAARILIAWRARNQRVDPITLDTPLRPWFWYRYGNGRSVVYGAEALIRYLLQSSTLREPTTNLEFTDEELRALDTIGRKLGLGSVYAHKYKGGAQRRSEILQVVHVLEIECQDVIATLCETLERLDRARGNITPIEILTELYFLVVPMYDEVIAQLTVFDRDAAQQQLSRSKSRLQAMRLARLNSRNAQHEIMARIEFWASLEPVV